MKLRFSIDPTYLVYHSLSSIHAQFYGKDVDISPLYDLYTCAASISSRLLLQFVKLDQQIFFKRTAPTFDTETNTFLQTILNTRQCRKILDETNSSLIACEEEWNRNHKNSTAIIQELTGLNLNKVMTVVITHPSIPNGRYNGHNRLEWRYHEEWPNYTTVYLWHEILHSYFGFDRLDHALIELVTDNELRVRLNGGMYPPFEGHHELNKLREILLSYWQEYLNAQSKNILIFRDHMKTNKDFISRSTGNLRCPICNQRMMIMEESLTDNGKKGSTYIQYRKTLNKCEHDDIWITAEIPVTYDGQY